MQGLPRSRRRRPAKGLVIGVEVVQPAGFGQGRNAHLLWAAGRELALSLVNWIWAAPLRIYVGAVLSALSVAIGGHAILRQVERHSSPLFAPANHQVSPAARCDLA